MIIAARDRIVDISDPYNPIAKINRPSLDNLEFFTEQEIRDAKALFETISYLFGHVSVRFVLMGMFNVYEGNGKVKIAINNFPNKEYLVKQLYRYNIISESQLNYLRTLTTRDIVDEHIFSLFFGNSFLYLPIIGVNRPSKNAVFFGYSPIDLFGWSFTGIDVFGAFNNEYLLFKQQVSKIKEFCTKSYNLWIIIKKIINDDTSLKSKQKDELIEKARIDVFNIQSSLRKNIDYFLTSLGYKPASRPRFLRINGYIIPITKDDVDGKDVLYKGGRIIFLDAMDYMFKWKRDPIWNT